ncbi:hypothetical protein C8J57DRAFT_1595771 [Mycena rebaudengoi]|nr:hypothetical protein C8J57DRAFT_1595771 [Mycena rebaudengoi]
MQLHTNANEHIVQENIETGVAILWKLHCCWYLGLVQKKENIPWSFTVGYYGPGTALKAAVAVYGDCHSLSGFLLPISVLGSQVKLDGGTVDDWAQTFTTRVSQQRTDGLPAPASMEQITHITIRTHVNSTVTSPPGPHPPPPEFPTGYVSLPSSPLRVMTVPRMHPEDPMGPQSGVSHRISQHTRKHDTEDCQYFGESGMDILYRHFVTSALHDSEERFAKPAYIPGTRAKILGGLYDWAVDVSPEAKPLLWLHGPAGAGKSVIAQEFAGRCHKDSRLGASFFFKRGHPQQGKWHGMLATIAFQLAIFSPNLRAVIQQTMEADKLLLGRALSDQFTRLFVPVLRQIPPRQQPLVIVIDGLDECEDYRIQAQVLRLLTGAIRDQRLSIRLLIVSRPEPQLRNIMANTLNICRRIDLSTDHFVDEDIRKYFSREFARIREERTAWGLIPETPWPSQSALDHLVKISSAVFIYASTVIRFVDDGYFHPNDHLESVLRLDPQSTVPLDDLYTEILSSASHNPLLLRVLHAALGRHSLRLRLVPEEIDLLLVLSPGSARLCLRSLHSVLHIPAPQTRYLHRQRGVDVLHASLRDYLWDIDRSGALCVALPSLDSALAHHAACILASPFKERPSPQQRWLYITSLRPRLVAEYQPPSPVTPPAEMTNHHQAASTLPRPRGRPGSTWRLFDSGPRHRLLIFGYTLSLFYFRQVRADMHRRTGLVPVGLKLCSIDFDGGSKRHIA